MKRMIKATEDRLVDLLAKTTSGKWEVIFEQIPESQATEIWRAGFATGDNRFSIETETGKQISEQNRRFAETFIKEQDRRKGENRV